MGPVRLYYYCTRGLNGFRARTCGFKCLEWPKSRTQTTRNADQDVERWKVSFIASGNANGTVTLEGSPNSFLQNEPLLPHTLAVTPLGILPNELKLMSTQRPSPRCLQQLLSQLLNVGSHQDVLR